MIKLISEFEYLSSEFGFFVIESYLSGSFPYVIWSNKVKNIKIVFDFTDLNPVHIFIYDTDDIAMFKSVEIYKELVYNPISNKEVDGYIVYAAKTFHQLLNTDNYI